MPILYYCDLSTMFRSIGEESPSLFRKTTPFTFQVHLLEDVGRYFLVGQPHRRRQARPRRAGDFERFQQKRTPTFLSETAVMQRT